MAYLYGDSSPSRIEVNYVDFLGKALDCCVELVLGDLAMARNGARARELEDRAVETAAAIAKVSEAVHEALAPICGQPADTPASDCANAIDRRSAAIAREHAAAVNARAEEALEALARADGRELERCREALERLLLEYPLPGATEELRLGWTGKTGGYSAHIAAVAPYKVETALAAAIPEGHPFASPVHVKDFARDLLVHVPKSAGWIRKQDKAVIRRLGKLFIGELRCARTAITAVLWQKPDPETEQFRVVIDRATETVTICGHPDASEDFDAEPGDWAEFERFERALRESLAALPRTSLIEVQIDGEPLDEGGPRELVSRLVAAMAPEVDEIARRSASPTELILREPQSDGKRTEIYVSKESLAAKLGALPSAEHPMFEPLGLGPVGKSIDLEVDLNVEQAAEDSDVEESEPSIEIIGEISTEISGEISEPQPEPVAST